MTFQIKQVGGICDKCGGKYVQSPKSGKVFCENKCWLTQTPVMVAPAVGLVGGVQGVDQQRIEKAMEKKRDGINSSVALNNAVDFASGCDMSVEDILKVAGQFRKWLDENTVGQPF